MRWILLAATILIFSYSVTLKYVHTKPLITTSARSNYMLDRRPMFPMVVYCNTQLPDDVTIFQSWFDEYRAWFNCDIIGRRNWDESWEYYCSIYNENTAANMYEWLDGMGADYCLINPASNFKLPTWDGEFNEYFKEQTKYGQYTLYRLDKSEGAANPEIIDNPVVSGSISPGSESRLQE